MPYASLFEISLAMRRHLPRLLSRREIPPRMRAARSPVCERRPVLLALAAIVLLSAQLAPQAVRADEAAPVTPVQTAPDPAPRDWEFQALAYGFLSSLDGTVGADGVSSDVNVGFLDLLDDVEWAIEGATELRYQRGLLLVDAIGNQLQVGGNAGPVTRPFQLVPGGPGGDLTVGPLDNSVRTTLWILDAKVGLRALSFPVSEILGSEKIDDPRRFDVDLFAGSRYWNVNTKIRLKIEPATLTIGGETIDLGDVDLPPIDLGPITVPGNLIKGGDFNVEETVDWVDGILGTRLRADVSESVSLFVLGDVGGFGIGDSSTLTWQVVGGLNWKFGERWGLVLAYRALAIERSGVVEDVTLYGPMLGLGFRY